MSPHHGACDATRARAVVREGRHAGEVGAQAALVDTLIDRLNGRDVFRLVFKLRMSDLNPPHDPSNPRLIKLLALYGAPQNRLRFLRGMEALCGLPTGSLVMYCPHDATMNAKIAKVNLYIEGDVSSFYDYEKNQSEFGLTRGALGAQVRRFYELWSAQVFIEAGCWSKLTSSAKQNLKSLIDAFFFQQDPGVNFEIVRSQMNVSVEFVQKETSLSAFRASFGNPPTVEKFKGFTFPSGMAFGIDS